MQALTANTQKVYRFEQKTWDQGQESAVDWKVRIPSTEPLATRTPIALVTHTLNGKKKLPFDKNAIFATNNSISVWIPYP